LVKEQDNRQDMKNTRGELDGKVRSPLNTDNFQHSHKYVHAKLVEIFQFVHEIL